MSMFKKLCKFFLNEASAENESNKKTGQIAILFMVIVKQEGSALLQASAHIWGVRAARESW